jgi:uncharacterized phage-associated protein
MCQHGNPRVAVAKEGTALPSAVDVAEEILQRQGTLDTLSLQKLVYYCQAYHLAQHHRPLFAEQIEAWANGPAIRSLFEAHRGRRRVSTVHGHTERLSLQAKESIERVIQFYGAHDSAWLVNQTHVDAPWAEARRGLSSQMNSSRPIPQDAIEAFYEPIFKDAAVDEALELAKSGAGLTPDEIRARYVF